MGSFTIIGEPQSKANSRRIVTNKKTGKPISIKSDKALDYVKDVRLQVTPLRPMLEGPLAAHISIYYASHRPDLDESLIFDALQGVVYKNDRQIVEKHIWRYLDRKNPRSHISIYEIPAAGERTDESGGTFAHARGRAA